MNESIKKNRPELIRCNHCGRDVNPKVVHCPFCAGKILVAPIFTNKPVCPRCSTDLEKHSSDDMEIDLCPDCGGIWLDKGEFRMATAESNVYRDFKLTEEYSRPSINNDFSYINCVRCNKLMIRENFKRISGVMIDRCGRHGVWLDSGELEKIRHFIADGGLDRAQNKDIARNSQELKDISTTVNETAFMVKLLHRFNVKRIFFDGF